MSGSRILIVKRRGLRYFLEAEPAFAAIRQAHPSAAVTLVTTDRFAPLVDGSPHVDEVVPLTARGMRRKLRKLVRVKRYDVIYDLDGTPSAFDLHATRYASRSSRLIGIEGRSPEGLAGPAMRKLLFDAGIAVQHRLPDPTFGVRALRRDPGIVLERDDPFALLLLSSAGERQWPEPAWHQLANALALQGITPVLIGERPRSSRGATPLRGWTERAIDLRGGTDLAQLAALAVRARFFVSNVAEELHLISALRCPGVVICDVADAVSETLFGREIISLMSSEVEAVAPSIVTGMLESMGVLGTIPTLRRHAVVS